MSRGDPLRGVEIKTVKRRRNFKPFVIARDKAAK